MDEHDIEAAVEGIASILERLKETPEEAKEHREYKLKVIRAFCWLGSVSIVGAAIGYLIWALVVFPLTPHCITYVMPPVCK